MGEPFKFKNKYNDVLKGTKWEVNPLKLKGQVVLVTGMAEHSKRYEDFATYLNKHGFSVYCLDHYGQGENGELMNPCDGYFFKYIETLKDLNKLIKDKHKDLPLIDMAHSMGSFILQGYIEKYSKTIDKCVLIGTNGKNPLVGVGYFLSKILINKRNRDKKAKLFHNLSIGAYVKSVKNRKSENDWISFNEENVKKYDDDPLCGVVPTNGFYKNFLKGLHSIQKSKNIDNISKDLDILIIGGDSDPVGNNGKGLVKLNKMYLRHGLKTRVIVLSNMRHEVLNEKEKDIPYEKILDFIRE